jgi:3-oxoadipate enol-lactonase
MLAETQDGAQINFKLYDFTEPWRPAETILLHHGLRTNHRLWHAWVPILAKHYQVVAIDARGREGSTIPEPGFNWHLDQFATDALAVVDSIGVDKFHWLGTSFGSVVGQYLAANYGDRLNTLSLLSPPYRFDHLKHVVDGWMEDYEKLGPIEFLRRDIKNMFPEDTDPEILEWHAQQMNMVPPETAKEMLTYMATINLADQLPNIKVPTLILAAKQSDRAPSTEAEFMVQQIPNCELIVFDGHHNISETIPEECADAVLAFLEKQKGGA